MTDDQLKYPIGKFSVPASYTSQDMQGWINDIKELPGKVRQAIIDLNETQLDTPYRPGGWTLRQVVHHLADSHMNSLIRFKWALTEDSPTIKAYDQAGWAMQHLVALFESFNEEQWDRYFVHPETGANVTLKRNLALYAWHSKHHLAHITNTIAGF
jgi:hypothetical protein